MASAHRHLEIRTGEWDAFLADLDHKLDKFNVPVTERAFVQSTYGDIVSA
jgi:hypothetical protein